MPSSNKLLPLLKPIHFSGRETRLTEQGLRFNYRVSHYDREAEISDTSGGDCVVEQLLERLQQLRRFTTVTANPRRPSARSLLRAMIESQRRLRPDEAISLRYGLSEKYTLRWQHQSAGDDSQGQDMVLVALDGDCPVGFVAFGIYLFHNPQDKSIYIYYNLNLVYVDPGKRGAGFGIDLSIACGCLCRDVLAAAYRAAPVGFTLYPVIVADFESQGGERFTSHVRESLDFEVDMLREAGMRRSIVVRHTEVDAGY